MLVYLYDEKKRNLLQEHLDEYDFFDVAYFLDSYDSVESVKDEVCSQYNKIAIDISDMIQDGNYYRIFTARYIRALSTIDDKVLCMRASLYDVLETRFPYLCAEMTFNTDFREPTVENLRVISIKDHKKLTLYTYENVLNMRTCVEKIISLSDLVDEWETFSVKYDIEKVQQYISEYKIEYIDISTAIRTLMVRHDLILQVEIMLYRISEKNDSINFCIDSTLEDDLYKIFPFLFLDKVQIDVSNKEVNDETSETIDVEKIEEQIKIICETLRGHDTFKNDFRNSLLKYYFLNNMGERKILSIMLCGGSGIGKTEFAKIVSDVIFPDEQMIKINFGNYSTEGVLNSLIGSPLGYIGSGEGGELINKVKTSKSKVILIDEFEKATPSVYNFFYELLEDGVFTDRHGKSHNLNGYIIIFTSNMSQQQYEKHIPDSLKSRFDMVYYFVNVPTEEKKAYIDSTSSTLISKLNAQFNVEIKPETIDAQLYKLLDLENLRDIKRKIEDIVFVEFFKNYPNKSNK